MRKTSRLMLQAVKNSRTIRGVDTAISATPLPETIELSMQHQDLRENFNFADVAKWKKIEQRYRNGTLHYAVPHLFHHRIMTNTEVARIMHLHDKAAKEFGNDIRKMTISQGKLMQQMVEAEFNNNM
eukprot:2597891-Karenia_brevis.AAC.1